MLKRHKNWASFRTGMVVPCSERNSMWTDTWCKRKGKKAPLPQPHCREWSSAGAHCCVYGSLSFEPWTSSLGHFKSPSSVVWTHQQRNSKLLHCDCDREGPTGFICNISPGEGELMKAGGCAAPAWLPHLICGPSTMLHNCATPRSKQSFISKPSKPERVCHYVTVFTK